MSAARLNPLETAPEGAAALMAVEAYLARSGLDRGLMELVKMRASQINGCAYCLDMHSRDARRRGETEQRLYLLDGWRESSLYTARERAALAWTEAVTKIAETHAAGADYAALRKAFNDKEVVDLTILVGMINLWNRLAISFRTPHPVAAGAPGNAANAPPAGRAPPE
ncbi:MAG: carboxymuconolactone decarboxylase family protein [Caulobacterales bacterium]|jgi:AhpD family alkylhydroperoxidase